MFSYPVRVLLGFMGMGYHLLIFKYEIDHQIGGRPYTEEECKPNEEPFIGQSSNIHNSHYRGSQESEQCEFYDYLIMECATKRVSCTLKELQQFEKRKRLWGTFCAMPIFPLDDTRLCLLLKAAFEAEDTCHSGPLRLIQCPILCFFLL